MAGFPLEEIFHHERPAPMRLSGVLSLGDGRSWNVALGLTLEGNREDFVFFEEDIEPIGLPPGPSDRLAVQSRRQLRDRDAYRLITVERRLAYGKAGIGEGSRLEPLAGRDRRSPIRRADSLDTWQRQPGLVHAAHGGG